MALLFPLLFLVAEFLVVHSQTNASCANVTCHVHPCYNSNGTCVVTPSGPKCFYDDNAAQPLYTLCQDDDASTPPPEGCPMACSSQHVCRAFCAPTAENVTILSHQNQSHFIDLIKNPTGDTLMPQINGESTSAGGAIALSNGIITYMPPSGNFLGLDTFEYQLCNVECSDWATVTVNVTVACAGVVCVPTSQCASSSDCEIFGSIGMCVDYGAKPKFTPCDIAVLPGCIAGCGDDGECHNFCPPVAQQDVLLDVDTGDTININVLENDSDPDNLPLHINLISLQSHYGGTLLKNENQTITYTPYNGFQGEDQIDYLVCNNIPLCTNGTVYLAVKASCKNYHCSPPDCYEQTSCTIFNGYPLCFHSSPSTPGKSCNLTGEIEDNCYPLCAGDGSCQVYCKPVGPDQLGLTYPQLPGVEFDNLLTQVNDPSNLPLFIQLLSNYSMAGANISLNDNLNVVFYYTPINFTGSDSFQYRACNILLCSDPITVNWTFVGCHNTHCEVNQCFESVSCVNFLYEYPKCINFNPKPMYTLCNSSEDTFCPTACSGSGTCERYCPPYGQNVTFQAMRNIATTVDLLSTAIDLNHAIMFPNLLSPVTVQQGSVYLDDKNLTVYTPPTDYLGLDSFEFKVCNPLGCSITYTATIQINPPCVGVICIPSTCYAASTCDNNGGCIDSQPLNLSTPCTSETPLTPGCSSLCNGEGACLEYCYPVVTPVRVTYPNGAPALLIPLLNETTDPQGFALSVHLVTQTSGGGGTLVLRSDATSVLYTPREGFIGTDMFQYKVCNTLGLCSELATATIDVAGICGTIQCQLRQCFTSVMCEEIGGRPTCFDMDPSEMFTSCNASTPPNTGCSSLCNGLGTCTNYCPPVPESDEYTVYLKQEIYLNVLTNDIDTHQLPLFVYLYDQWSDLGAQISIAQNKSILYQGLSDPQTITTDSFLYRVCNGANLCSNGTVLIQIRNTVIGAPEAILSDSGSEIHVLFKTPTYATGSMPCESVLSYDSLIALGTNPQCYWDPQSLKIILGVHPTFPPQMTITLTWPTQQQTFIQDMAVLPTPTVTLFGPSQIGATEELKIAAQASGSGGRTLTFSWSLSDSSKTSYPDIFNIIRLQTSSTLLLPSSHIPVGSSITYIVTVTNWFGKSTSNNKTITKQDSLKPSLSFPDTIYIASYESIHLSVPIQFLQSENTYKWQIIEATGPGPNIIAQDLYFPPYHFEGKEKVQISLTVVHTSTGLTNQIVTNIIVLKSPILALINGSRSSSLNINHFSTILLSASDSNDPDYQNAPLSFSWICQTNAGLPCLESGTANHDTSTLSVSASQLTSDVSSLYTVSVNVSHAGKSSTASITLHILPNPVPILDISLNSFAPNGKINIHSKLVLKSRVGTAQSNLKWSCLTGNFDLKNSNNLITSINDPNLVFLPSTLLPGETYSFGLTSSDIDGNTGSKSITFETNTIPFGGSCGINPIDGTAATLFTISCPDWTDDNNNLPLEYSLSSINSKTGEDLLLVPFQSNSEFLTQFPPSTDDLVITLSIRNRHGAISTTSLTTQVYPENSDKINTNLLLTQVSALSINDKTISILTPILSSIIGYLNYQASTDITGQHIIDRITVRKQLILLLDSANRQASLNSVDIFVQFAQLLQGVSSQPREIGFEERNIIINLLLSLLDVTAGLNDNFYRFRPLPYEFFTNLVDTLDNLGQSANYNLTSYLEGGKTDKSELAADESFASIFPKVITGISQQLLADTVAGENYEISSGTFTLHVIRDYTSKFSSSSKSLSATHLQSENGGFILPDNYFQTANFNPSIPIDVTVFISSNILSYQDVIDHKKDTIEEISPLLSLSITQEGTPQGTNPSPFQVIIPMSSSFTKDQQLICRQWDNKKDEPKWDTTTCQLSKIEKLSVTCTCKGFGSFSAKAVSSTLSLTTDQTALTIQNILNCPVPSLVCLLTIILFIPFIIGAMYKDHRALGARETRPIPLSQCWAYFMCACNRHFWLSIFAARTDENNLRSSERLSVLIAWFTGALALNSIFFGTVNQVESNALATGVVVALILHLPLWFLAIISVHNRKCGLVLSSFITSTNFFIIIVYGLRFSSTTENLCGSKTWLIGFGMTCFIDIIVLQPITVILMTCFECLHCLSLKRHDPLRQSRSSPGEHSRVELTNPHLQASDMDGSTSGVTPEGGGRRYSESLNSHPSPRNFLNPKQPPTPGSPMGMGKIAQVLNGPAYYRGRGESISEVDIGDSQHDYDLGRLTPRTSPHGSPSLRPQVPLTTIQEDHNDHGSPHQPALALQRLRSIDGQKKEKTLFEAAIENEESKLQLRRSTSRSKKREVEVAEREANESERGIDDSSAPLTRVHSKKELRIAIQELAKTEDL